MDLFQILFVIILILALTLVQTLEGRYYALRDDLRYREETIIKQLEGISQMQCLLSCNREEGCESVAFNHSNRSCKLLRKSVDNDDEHYLPAHKDEKIYSFVPGNDWLLFMKLWNLARVQLSQT